MDIKVDLKPEDLQKAVVDAVIKSSIGEQIKKVIDAELAKFSRSYDNPLENALKSEVGRLIVDSVRQDHGERIKAAIREMITDEVLNQTIEAAWNAFLGKIRSEAAIGH